MDKGVISLRPITYADTKNIVRWRNTPEVKSKFVMQGELTEEMHENYMRTRVDTGQVVQFIIVLNETGLDIGTVFLKDVDRERGCGEGGIFIGEPKYQNTGLGFVAGQVMNDYVFSELGLRFTYARVRKENKNAIKVNRMFGYEIVDDPAAYGIPDPNNPDVVYMILRNPNEKEEK